MTNLLLCSLYNNVWSVATCFVMLATLMLTSCGVDRKHFRIEGRLLNFNQGEFYVYSEDGTIQGIDTIKVEGGRFSYERPCPEATTLTIVFPNFSEQPVFAEPGKKVEMNGDASHLKELKIKGTETNELMSKFREQVAQASPPDAQRAAIQFVKDHPASAASVWITRHYLVANPTPDYATAATLVKLMMKQQSKNPLLMQLERYVSMVDKVGVGAALPSLSATDDKGRNIDVAALRTGTTVVLTWASWSYDSMDMLRRVKQLQREKRQAFKVISVGLDASKHDEEPTLKGDSITWPNVCDGQLFEGTVVKAWGLYGVPTTLLVKDGRIVARNLSFDELKSRLGAS